MKAKTAPVMFDTFMTVTASLHYKSLLLNVCGSCASTSALTVVVVPSLSSGLQFLMFLQIFQFIKSETHLKNRTLVFVLL